MQGDHSLSEVGVSWFLTEGEGRAASRGWAAGGHSLSEVGVSWFLTGGEGRAVSRGQACRGV